MIRAIVLAALLALAVGCEGEDGEFPDFCPGVHSVAADEDSSCDDCRALWGMGPGATVEQVCAHDLEGANCFRVFQGGPPNGAIHAVLCDEE